MLKLLMTLWTFGVGSYWDLMEHVHIHYKSSEGDLNSETLNNIGCRLVMSTFITSQVKVI